MSSTAVSKGVTERLEGMDLVFSFKPERRVFPRTNIKNLDTVYVSVFKGPRLSEEITRGSWQRSYSVFVVVQKKLPAEEATQVTESDKLTDFVEAIERVFEESGDVTGYTLDRFDETAERLPFDAELLYEVGVFSAFFGLIFLD